MLPILPCLAVAFPSISTGIYQFPKEKAAKIAIQTVLKYLENENNFEQIILVSFDEENFALLKTALAAALKLE